MAQSPWDVLELKRLYPSASHELLARRMLDHWAPVIISIFDQGKLSFRRGNLGRRAPPVSPLEQTCREAAHLGGCTCRDADTVMTVQAWAIHEPNWKREILRTHWRDE